MGEAEARTVLGVSASASWAEIEKAYKELAQIYHPDRFATSSEGVRKNAESRMVRVNQAFQELKRLPPTSRQTSPSVIRVCPSCSQQNRVPSDKVRNARC